MMITSKRGIIDLSFNVTQNVTNPKIVRGIDDKGNTYLAVVSDEVYNDWKEGGELNLLATFNESLEPVSAPTDGTVWSDHTEKDESLVFSADSRMVNYLYSLNDTVGWQLLVPLGGYFLRATRLRVSALGTPENVKENSPALVQAIAGALCLLSPRINLVEGREAFRQDSGMILSGQPGAKTINGCTCVFSSTKYRNSYPLQRFKSQFKTDDVMVFIDVTFEVLQDGNFNATVPNFAGLYGGLTFDARDGSDQINSWSWTYRKYDEIYFCYATSSGPVDPNLLPVDEMPSLESYCVMKIGDVTSIK